jgi:hypothetical protein
LWLRVVGLVGLVLVGAVVLVDSEQEQDYQLLPVRLTQ